jgi:cellulose synthase/poly-beta-1,6-N-acetylglucosamine synthase-like glycosyltransferase
MNSLPSRQLDHLDSYPKVSVVVPIYNGKTDLPDLITCLCTQTYPRDRVEYLLVDNASQDTTATIIQNSTLEASHKDITIRHLSEYKIQSSYAARNTGILASEGEILAFTDIDCRPHPDWLEKLVQPFNNPGIGIVSGAIAALPGKTLFEKYAEQHRVLSQEDHFASHFLPFGATANLAIRRQIFQELGLFRPHLTTGGDTDICWRVQLNSSWRLYYTHTAIVQHRHRDSFQGLLKQYYRYGRGRRYLEELYGIEISPESRWNTTHYLRRWKHWLFKEVPPMATQILSGRSSVLDFLNTPITILVGQALAIGQMNAKLSEKAKQIQNFNEDSNL